MPGGLSEIVQADWSAGMFQGVDVQRIPANGAYDITNGLIDADEGDIYRRGGAAYKTPADIAITPLMIWDGGLGGGQRTYVGNASTIYSLDANDTTVTALSMTGTPVGSARPVVVGGMAFWPSVSAGGLNGWVMAAGARQASNYTGTGDIVAGSSTVNVTSGVALLANTQPGAVFTSSDVTGYAVPIVAIGSSTLTLAAPWPGASHSTAALAAARSFAVYHADLTTNAAFPVYLASAANRLWWMNGNLIRFTDIAKYAEASAILSNYHELPSGEAIRGGKMVGGVLLVFTNGGAWAVRNPGLDLTDSAGQPQQQLSLVYPELRLWHINGVVSWKGALVVPATDNIYLIDGASSPVPIGNPITKLYRSYTAAGYTLGAASITSSTYTVPVLNGTTWVDTLTCYLPTRAWSHQAGYSGASIGFASRVSTTGTETLLSIRALRILDCTGWFTPTSSNKNDADGSTHTFSVTTRDYTLGTLKALVKKVRVWVEGVDAASDDPTLSVSYAAGPAGSSFTSVTGSVAESTGDTPSVVSVNASGKHMRFKLSSTNPWASLKLKALDVFVRPRGRQ